MNGEQPPTKMKQLAVSKRPSSCGVADMGPDTSYPRLPLGWVDVAKIKDMAVQAEQGGEYACIIRGLPRLVAGPCVLSGLHSSVNCWGCMGRLPRTDCVLPKQSIGVHHRTLLLQTDQYQQRLGWLPPQVPLKSNCPKTMVVSINATQEKPKTRHQGNVGPRRHFDHKKPCE